LNDGNDYGPEYNEYIINYINYNENVEMNVEYDEDVGDEYNEDNVGDEDDEDVVDEEPWEVPYWYYPNFWLYHPYHIGPKAPWGEPWNDGGDYGPEDNE
jgi:hypothetical protein